MYSENRRTTLKLAPLLIAGLFILFQFLSADRFTNPETGKSERVALSPQQEETLGLQAYQEVLSTSKVVQSGPEADMVRRVASKIASATGNAGADFNWEVTLVNSPQVNAFCLPRGKIVVYTGILPVTENEAGLATVLGHEVAHAIARHGAQRVFQNSITQTALIGAAYSMSDMDYQKRQTIMGLLGAGAQYGVLLPFSRSHESEADEMGLIYMARAGYDPRESITFWQRMNETGGSQPPEFLSTHPSHGHRIEDLKAFLPRAMQEYEKAGGTPAQQTQSL
jgi:predicted Zn-dependent protease